MAPNPSFKRTREGKPLNSNVRAHEKEVSMHEVTSSVSNQEEKIFFAPSRIKLIAFSIVIVLVSAIACKVGLNLTKGVDLTPKDFFLYLYFATPVLVAIFVGIKEKLYPYRVVLIISVSFSLASYLTAAIDIGREAAIKPEVIFAFLQEGIMIALFLVLITLVAHKVVCALTHPSSGTC